MLSFMLYAMCWTVNKTVGAVTSLIWTSEEQRQRQTMDQILKELVALRNEVQTLKAIEMKSL